MGSDPDHLAFMRMLETAPRQGAAAGQPIGEGRAARAAGLARVPRPPVAARVGITAPGGDGDLPARVHRASTDPAPAGFPAGEPALLAGPLAAGG